MWKTNQPLLATNGILLDGSTTQSNQLLINLKIPAPSIDISVPYSAFDVARTPTRFPPGQLIGLIANGLGSAFAENRECHGAIAGAGFVADGSCGAIDDHSCCGSDHRVDLGARGRGRAAFFFDQKSDQLLRPVRSREEFGGRVACQVLPSSRLGEGAQALNAPADKFRD